MVVISLIISLYWISKKALKIEHKGDSITIVIHTDDLRLKKGNEGRGEVNKNCVVTK